MFNSRLLESEMSTIRLQGVCPDVMVQLILFMYSGHLTITEKTVCPLLTAASMYQVCMITFYLVCTFFVSENMTLILIKNTHDH